MGSMSRVDLTISGDNLWSLIREAYRQGYLNGHIDGELKIDNSSDQDIDDWLGEAMCDNAVGDVPNEAETITQK